MKKLKEGFIHLKSFIQHWQGIPVSGKNYRGITAIIIFDCLNYKPGKWSYFIYVSAEFYDIATFPLEQEQNLFELGLGIPLHVSGKLEFPEIHFGPRQYSEFTFNDIKKKGANHCKKLISLLAPYKIKEI